jgi:imidazoleglycerol phosphate dehydratase HisB
MPHEPFLDPPLDVRNEQTTQKALSLTVKIAIHPFQTCSKSNTHHNITSEFRALPVLQSYAAEFSNILPIESKSFIM